MNSLLTRREADMHNLSYGFLWFTILGLLICPAAIGEQIGYDSVTGQKRVVRKNDKTLVGTKQSIDAGEVVQRNALGITILAPSAKLDSAQFSDPKECIGKIAKISCKIFHKNVCGDG